MLDWLIVAFKVSDPITQSMPFGYITVDVKVNDSNAHLVQVYMDITGGLLGKGLPAIA